ncbi:hypothetical protein HanOQP8_Chr10g0361431 [Helianthus annuus]|nr:hypothetical protein HanOQP8_Chr10g0361431 [Helianthus annuus]
MGGLVSIPFDRLATYTPVGDACDMFSREVGIYMWENLAFDKYSYTNVSAAEKNAMEQHLRVNVYGASILRKLSGIANVVSLRVAFGRST